MKLNLVVAEVIEAANATAFKTALNAFFQTATERTYVDFRWQLISGTYTAVILYSEQ